MSNLSGKRANRGLKAFVGLSPEQRIRVKAELDGHTVLTRGDHDRTGWSIYRQPTTIDPPTVLRLFKRNEFGKVVLVVNITEDGVMV